MHSMDDLQTGLLKVVLVAIIGWLGCQMDSLLGAVFENRGYLTKGGVNGISITLWDACNVGNTLIRIVCVIGLESLSKGHRLHEPKPSGDDNAPA